MARWVGAQGQIKLVKNLKTPSFRTSPTENRKSKAEIFFSTETRKLPDIRRGLEQLSSSSGWRFMAKNVSSALVKGFGA